jgi:hypothetical protein
MISRLIRSLVVMASLVAGAPALASFHLFSIAEVYTNADGSVQYIELIGLANSQNLFAGHTLVNTSAAGMKTFQFQTNLPNSNTGGARVLVGTPAMAALNVVAPDYATLPANFLDPNGGTLTFGEGADSWTYGPLPTNGNQSLDRTGVPTTNSPRNFAGQTGTIVPTATNPITFQGLWWRNPPGSEDGWGVNLTHQGDILFATWFTYDAAGDPLWLVVSNGARTGTDTFTGTMFRTTGPVFSAVPFDPGMVVATPVGSATFTFISANEGSFTYTFNGVTQTKQITRQIFANPPSTCTAGGTASATPNYQDLWYRAPAESESGWGVNITHQADTLFATWFTYAAGGTGQWLVMSNLARTSPTSNTYSGSILRTRGPAFNSVPWNNSQFTFATVGTASFTFANAENGTFNYTLDGITQSKPIVRQVYSSPASVCRTTP